MIMSDAWPNMERLKASWEPKCVFLNQSAGPLFLELAEDLANQIGELHVVAGSQIKNQSSALTIRSAPGYDRRTLLRRALSWTRFLIAAVREIWRVRPVIPLVVVSNPPPLPWLVMLANLIRRQPYIMLVYDIYPDILIKLGYLSHSHFLTRLWRLLNRLAYQRAEHVVTIGRHMEYAILNEYLSSEKCEKRLTVIPTWVDTTRFVPVDKQKNHFAIQNKLQDMFTVLYSGNIGYTHNIEILIDAAKQLRDQPTLRFLIIGDGSSKRDLLLRACSNSLTNVTFLPFQPEEVLPYSLAVADVSVVSIAKNIEGLMMPSKTYFAMAVGSALIGISQPPNDLSDIIEKYGCGVNIVPDDLDGFVAAILRFQKERDYLVRCQTAARKAAVRHFSRMVNSQRLAQLIMSCLNIQRP